MEPAPKAYFGAGSLSINADRMRNKKRLVWLALLAFLGGPFATSWGAEAEPGFIAVPLAPGKVHRIPIKLRTNLPVEKVLVQPVDYAMDRNGRVVLGQAAGEGYSAKDWCKLAPVEIVLRQGRETVLEVPVHVPQGTRGGEYYAGLQIASADKRVPQNQTVQMEIEASMVVMMVLGVKGSAPKLAAEVIEPNVVLEDSIPRFSAVFKSLCTVSVIARTSVLIRDEEQKILDKIWLQGAGSAQPDGQGFVLPGGIRDFSGQGNRKLRPGKYTAEIAAIFGKKHLRTSINLPFEVKEGAAAASPLQDILVQPARMVLEVAPGSLNTQIMELKNRGFDPVHVQFKSDHEGVTFFPETVALEPGKIFKIRISVRLGKDESPRRDVSVQLQREASNGEDSRPIVISLYAPGMAPKFDPVKDAPKVPGSVPIQPGSGLPSDPPMPPPTPSDPPKGGN